MTSEIPWSRNQNPVISQYNPQYGLSILPIIPFQLILPDGITI